MFEPQYCEMEESPHRRQETGTYGSLRVSLRLLGGELAKDRGMMQGTLDGCMYDVGMGNCGDTETTNKVQRKTENLYY